MITVPTDIPTQAVHTNINNSNQNISNLSFASHNVRSFNHITKQTALLDLYSLHKLDIIGLQETNFTLSSIRPFNSAFSSKFFGFFGSQPINNKQQSGFGVGLLLQPHLANHVFHHESKFNRIILVDLHFANKQKIRVINCYLSPSDPILKKTTQFEVLKYIRDASSDNYHIVLLGDFNADLDNPRLSKADKRFSHI